MTQSDIEFDLGTATLSCTVEDVAATFAGMLQEMRAAALFVPADERAVLRRIMGRASGTYTVEDVFPDFARDSGALTTLRRLRTAQFIRPAGRDMWDRGERIAIKPFARLVWDRLGEDAIFAPAEDAPEAAAADEVDLAAPEVDELGSRETARLESDELAVPGSKETARLKNNPAAAWDDDDVLDFLKDDTPG
ncbi:hypothetical protein [Frigoriglobus tundricola]|uniref:Uncharacterized protein n=1 Tax=Frigoriglobus tundricola TaxID=2774151 RepID=A0A6M5YNM5_9BACT|nr:hypothetical protein [Frigoriglobus tundricola]QJW94851.1 hypothetical protein FTUN_2377 [Frigoriglobus tundricola]